MGIALVALIVTGTLNLTSYNVWKPASWNRADARDLVISSVTGNPVVAGGR